MSDRKTLSPRLRKSPPPSKTERRKSSRRKSGSRFSEMRRQMSFHVSPRRKAVAPPPQVGEPRLINNRSGRAASMGDGGVPGLPLDPASLLAPDLKPRPRTPKAITRMDLSVRALVKGMPKHSSRVTLLSEIIQSEIDVMECKTAYNDFRVRYEALFLGLVDRPVGQTLRVIGQCIKAIGQYVQAVRQFRKSGAHCSREVDIAYQVSPFDLREHRYQQLMGRTEELKRHLQTLHRICDILRPMVERPSRPMWEEQALRVTQSIADAVDLLEDDFGKDVEWQLETPRIMPEFSSSESTSESGETCSEESDEPPMLSPRPDTPMVIRRVREQLTTGETEEGSDDSAEGAFFTPRASGESN